MNILGIIASSKFAAAGDFESIATVSVGSGGAATVTFSSIPATYTHLQVRYIAQTNRGTFGRDTVGMRINSDSASNYSCHFLSGDGSGVSAGADTSPNIIRTGVAGTTTAGTYFFGAGIIDLLDYANTNKYKTVRTFGGNDVNGTVGGAGGEAVYQSGNWRNTSAITSLTFSMFSGTTFSQNSVFALYGIKGA